MFLLLGEAHTDLSFSDSQVSLAFHAVPLAMLGSTSTPHAQIIWLGKTRPLVLHASPVRQEATALCSVREILGKTSHSVRLASRDVRPDSSSRVFVTQAPTSTPFLALIAKVAVRRDTTLRDLVAAWACQMKWHAWLAQKIRIWYSLPDIPSFCLFLLSVSFLASAALLKLMM